MKINILIIVIFLYFFNFGNNAYSQTTGYYIPPTTSGVYIIDPTVPQWYQNLNKYWFYRYRLVNDFTCIGPNPGESIIAYRRIKGDNKNPDGGIPDYQNTLDFAADQTEDLANYMSVLATEYEQLKQNGLSTARTLYEIKYAQNAYDRLRKDTYNPVSTLNGYYTNADFYPVTPQDLITTDIENGFFVRDDVPFVDFLDPTTNAINAFHYQHFNRNYLINSFPPAPTSCVNCNHVNPLKSVKKVFGGSLKNYYTGTTPPDPDPPTLTNPYPNCESQDQLEEVFMGEALLIKFLDDGAVTDQRAKAQNALYHTMSFINHYAGSSTYTGLTTGYFIPLNIPFFSIPDPTSPNTMCAKNSCDNSGIFYPSSLPAMYATARVLAGSPWESDANGLKDDVTSFFKYWAYTFYRSELPLCCDVSKQNVLYPAVYTCFAAEYRPAVSFFGPAFDYWLWSATSTEGLIDRSWKQICHQSEAMFFNAPHLPLLFELNFGDKPWRGVNESFTYNNFIKHLLNIAPKCGTWNYEKSITEFTAYGTEDWHNEHNSYANVDWSGNSLVHDAEHRQGIDCFSGVDNCNFDFNNMNSDCEFNGLDYMELFNFFALERGAAGDPYLGGIFNSYYCEDFNVDYPQASFTPDITWGSYQNKLTLNWLEYLSARNIVHGDLYSPCCHEGWLEYRGAKVVDLKPGFWAQYGCFFEAHIQDYNCSGGDIMDGPYNFAEMSFEGCPGCAESHGGGRLADDTDTTKKITGFHPVAYLPYGSGYKARPLPKSDNTENIVPNMSDIPNIEEYKNLYRDSVKMFVNLVRQSPKLQEMLGLTDDSLTKILSYFGDSLTVNLYPNPTTSVAYLAYHLSNASNVAINCTNAIGQNFNYLIEQYDEYQLPGEHKTTINTDRLTPGLYYITIKIGNYITTKKLTVL